MGSSVRVTYGFALLVGVAGGACGGGDASEALRLAAPFTEDFSRYDAWARRTLGARSAIRGEGQLEETLFAPLALESEVVDVWVERRSEPAQRYSMRGGASLDGQEGWVRARDPSLGELSVLEAPVGGAPCVVLARDEADPEGVAVRVSVAYAAAE